LLAGKVSDPIASVSGPISERTARSATALAALNAAHARNASA